MKLRVLIADDHRLFRDGLRTLLEKEPNIEIIGEATDGPSAVVAAGERKPDVVLMDISMPVLNGIEATRKITTENPAVRVIMLSMHSDRRFVIESLKAGAIGYLVKDCAIDELLAAIRAVVNKRMYLSAAIAESVLKDYIGLVKSTPGSAFSVLTAREREVLQSLAEGGSTKEVAAHLQVSIKTIETHRKQIMDKLGIHSIAELTKYAIREGLTPLE
jgi:DNA-binding NarL/FixJ family response regulator